MARRPSSGKIKKKAQLTFVYHFNVNNNSQHLWSFGALTLLGAVESTCTQLISFDCHHPMK